MTEGIEQQLPSYLKGGYDRDGLLDSVENEPEHARHSALTLARAAYETGRRDAQREIRAALGLTTRGCGTVQEHGR